MMFVKAANLELFHFEVGQACTYELCSLCLSELYHVRHRGSIGHQVRMGLCDIVDFLSITSKLLYQLAPTPYVRSVLGAISSRLSLGKTTQRCYAHKTNSPDQWTAVAVARRPVAPAGRTCTYL